MRPASLFLFLFAAFTLNAEEWPGWRGPRGDGTSKETNVPLEWSTTKNVCWKAALPGTGHSSPVIFGDRVFISTCVQKEGDGDKLLLCLDRRDGKVLWQKTVVSSKLERKHKDNSFASGTPATDGKHIYIAFSEYPNMVAVCYDLDGNEVWRMTPGTLKSVHGFCTSPVLHKNLVILNGDQDDPKSFMTALDKLTGKEVWRVDRPNHIRSYCTPLLIHAAKEPNVTQLVLAGSKTVASYDADTGKLLWIHNGPTEQYVASLVFDQDILCLTTGFPDRHLMGFSPYGHGDITKTDQVLWHIPPSRKGDRDNAAYVPSPIAADGYFYIVSDFGMLSCIEAKSGKRVFQERLGDHHYSSPIRVGGHIVFIDDDGIGWVIKPGPKLEVVRKNVLDERVDASPAVSHGQLFIRTATSLYCIGQK